MALVPPQRLSPSPPFPALLCQWGWGRPQPSRPEQPSLCCGHGAQFPRLYNGDPITPVSTAGDKALLVSFQPGKVIPLMDRGDQQALCFYNAPLKLEEGDSFYSHFSG